MINEKSEWLIFPRVISVEKRWEEVRSNLKIWGFTFEESVGGGVKVTRCRDGKSVVLMWAELYDCGLERKDLEEYFIEENFI